jgi:hypothetical protein
MVYQGDAEAITIHDHSLQDHDDLSYLETALNAASHDIAETREHDRRRVLSSGVSRLFRPRADEGVTW